MKRLLTLSGFKIGLIVALILMALKFFNPGFMKIVNFMELKSYDLRLQWRGEKEPGDEIVIVTVDDKSLDELGRWPWPRAIIAQFLDRMAEYGAAVVGFDVVFSEPDDSSGLSKLLALKAEVEEERPDDPLLKDFLNEAIAEADNDAKMAAALRDYEHAILGYFFHFSAEDIKHYSSEQLQQFYENIVWSEFEQVYMDQGLEVPVKGLAVESNIQILSDNARGFGYFNVFPDADGIVRKMPLMIQYRDVNTPFPPLSLQMVKEYVGANNLVAVIGYDDTVVGLETADTSYVIPTDSSGNMLVNYYGGRERFPYVSFTDVVHGRVAPETFTGKMAFVGASATGIMDLRATPFDTVYPGVEIHATVADNVLHGNFIVRPERAEQYDLIIIAIVGVVLGLILQRIKALHGTLLSIGFAGGYLFFNKYYFDHEGMWLDLVYPLMTIGLVHVSVTIFRYVTEEKEKRFIKSAFGYYLAPAVIDTLLADPSKLNLGGERKVLTAFFSDIAGFSGISEKLTPEELVSLLNEYLTDMSNIIMESQGTVDKYEGDAIIAFWGAPVEIQDHAVAGCYAALDMQARLNEMRKKWKEEGRAEIRVRMGINSGPMVVGNMGSLNRMDYTIMGDAVNLASRLEGTNKQYGTYIMIGEDTYNLARDRIEVRELDRIRVVGKTQPVIVYELIGRRGEITPDQQKLIQTYHEGLKAYRERKWEEAVSLFARCIEMNGDDPPSRMFIQRCQEYKASPPPEGWDTVYVRTEK